MKRVSFKGIILPLLLAVVGASIAVGAYVTTTGGSLFELRKKASDTKGSQLVFTAPKQVEVGKPFTVELVLDTTGDPNYTISGVDAQIAIANDLSGKDSRTGEMLGAPQGMPADLHPNVLLLTNVTPGKIFDSYPNVGNTGPPVRDPPTCGGFLGGKCPSGLECIDDPSDSCDPNRGGADCGGICVSRQWTSQQSYGEFLTISGVKNYAVDEKDRFKGFTGTGVVATLTFVAERPGKATLKLAYTSSTATDDTNITGFLANQPASLQKPQERLTMTPDAFTIGVVSATPTASVTPPPCIPLPPGCGPQPNGGFIACDPPQGKTFCKPTPTSTPSGCIPIPDCVDGIEDITGRKIGICQLTPPPPGQTYCPRPTTAPRPTVLPTPTPTPTPTPEPRVMISFRLALEDRKSHATVVDIYGMMEGSKEPPSKELLQALGTGEAAFLPGNRIDKLGTAITNSNGIGVLSLSQGYAGGRYMFLLAQTPSHLRKAANNYQGIRLDVGQNPVCRAEICTQEVKYVDFGILTAGDVYTDEKGNKDNLINTFDVGAVYAAWSGADVVGREEGRSTFLPEQPALADLNGDGVVNNRDLAMLLANFNKRGQ